MKFTDVLKGKRAEKPVEVPGFTDKDGKPFTVILVPLTGLEFESACADARARAISKGIPDPRMGEPVYDLALQAFVLYYGCMDPDSDSENRAKTFASGEQILENLHPETIVYLHEMHELHQNETSPYVHKIGGNEFIDRLREVAGPSGQATFMGFSLSTRVSFTLSTARMLLPLLEAKLPPGSTSGST